jgi:hypothetical protein
MPLRATSLIWMRVLCVCIIQLTACSRLIQPAASSRSLRKRRSLIFYSRQLLDYDLGSGYQRTCRLNFLKFGDWPRPTDSLSQYRVCIQRNFTAILPTKILKHSARRERFVPVNGPALWNAAKSSCTSRRKRMLTH